MKNSSETPSSKEYLVPLTNKHVDAIMGGVNNEWQDLMNWKIPVMGFEESQMIFAELRKRGCELRQSDNRSGWEVKKKQTEVSSQPTEASEKEKQIEQVRREHLEAMAIALGANPFIAKLSIRKCLITPLWT